ncbi:cytochrome c oxidase assembly protein [Oceanobacillus longus]|uniref:Cytochrome c oxidase assembly protein n=1 Tax=Oceanobacillus longus TaxID=930120 RepID=A0ABV8H0F3_9BACI
MNHDMYQGFSLPLEYVIAFCFLLLLGIYIVAGIITSRRTRLRWWPLHRYIFWVLGIFCTALAIIGPIAQLAHTDFRIHMLVHLLLGMVGPLFLALAAPMTLLLRTIPVIAAKKVTGLLKSLLIRFLSHPIIAAILNMGGLWVLYTTDLYIRMHQSLAVYILIHIHVFLAGYIFTVAMIYIDPITHRYSFIYRSVVLVLSLASHGILAKYIYANPPNGVPVSQAEFGGMLMYYGGDAVDLILIFILCLHWYKAAQPYFVENKKLNIN